MLAATVVFCIYNSSEVEPGYWPDSYLHRCALSGLMMSFNIENQYSVLMIYKEIVDSLQLQDCTAARLPTIRSDIRSGGLYNAMACQYDVNTVRSLVVFIFLNKSFLPSFIKCKVDVELPSTLLSVLTDDDKTYIGVRLRDRRTNNIRAK